MSKFLRQVAEATAEQQRHEVLTPPLDHTGAIGDTSAPITPKMVEIVRLLQQDLTLVEPTLRAVKELHARVARAKLVAIYGEEEFSRMAAELTAEESR